jgi:hypothetical protein
VAFQAESTQGGCIVSAGIIDSLRHSQRPAAMALAQELHRFNRFSEETEIDVAIIIGGRALEMVIRNVCGTHNIHPDGKPEDLLNRLRKESSLDELTHKHCVNVKNFRKTAAHAVASTDELKPERRLSRYELTSVANSLEVVVGWYSREMLPQLPEVRTFRVLRGSAVTEDHLIGATEIDKFVYPEQFRGIPEVLFKWHNINRDIFTIVEDTMTKKTVGCLTVLPISERLFQRIQEGAVVDVELPLPDIRKFDVPDFYKLYIASVIVDPAYEGSDVFRLLYESYLAKLLELAQREMYATELLADVISDDGIRLAEFLGMRKLRPTQHGSSIYKTTLLPPAVRVTTQTCKKLTAYYKSKYGELKELLELLPEAQAS